MLSIGMEVAVIDTSVFVSALMRADTPPRQVLRLCLERRVTPLMGNPLFAEYEAVMSREDLFRGALLDEGERRRLLDAYLSVCRWVRIYYLWRPNLADEGDNHLVELALAGGAGWIVTGNRADLTSGELRFPGLRIASPTEFIMERS
jgi:uncharacterized protein